MHTVLVCTSAPGFCVLSLDKRRRRGLHSAVVTAFRWQCLRIRVLGTPPPGSNASTLHKGNQDLLFPSPDEREPSEEGGDEAGVVVARTCQFAGQGSVDRLK
jgi:hypothetical protein